MRDLALGDEADDDDDEDDDADASCGGDTGGSSNSERYEPKNWRCALRAAANASVIVGRRECERRWCRSSSSCLAVLDEAWALSRDVAGGLELATLDDACVDACRATSVVVVVVFVVVVVVADVDAAVGCLALLASLSLTTLLVSTAASAALTPALLVGVWSGVARSDEVEEEAAREDAGRTDCFGFGFDVRRSWLDTSVLALLLLLLLLLDLLDWFVVSIIDSVAFILTDFFLDC